MRHRSIRSTRALTRHFRNFGHAYMVLDLEFTHYPLCHQSVKCWPRQSKEFARSRGVHQCQRGLSRYAAEQGSELKQAVNDAGVAG